MDKPYTVIISQTKFEPFPTRLTCPYCNIDVKTIIRSKNGISTWLTSGYFCILGGWFGCCLIPFCASSCKDIVHSCPNCKIDIGLFKRV